MSESERKSHISDDQLAKLTERKLQELEQERRELNDKLLARAQNGDPGLDTQRLERQIENHDAASEKPAEYREKMLDGRDDER